jgi:hypothetical protein
MNDREKRLAIAKLAYLQISRAIDELEATGLIHAHWDECISVDGELFHGHELKSDDGTKENNS